MCSRYNNSTKNLIKKINLNVFQHPYIQAYVFCLGIKRTSFALHHSGMRLKNMMDIETYIYVTDLEQITDSDFNYFSKTLKTCGF